MLQGAWQEGQQNWPFPALGYSNHCHAALGTALFLLHIFFLVEEEEGVPWSIWEPGKPRTASPTPRRSKIVQFFSKKSNYFWPSEGQRGHMSPHYTAGMWLGEGAFASSVAYEVLGINPSGIPLFQPQQCGTLVCANGLQMCPRSLGEGHTLVGALRDVSSQLVGSVMHLVNSKKN